MNKIKDIKTDNEKLKASIADKQKALKNNKIVKK